MHKILASFMLVFIINLANTLICPSKDLIVNCSSLQLTSLPSDITMTTLTIFFNRNKLIKIHKDMFGNVSQVQNLDLSENLITLIDKNAFNHLTAIRTINLNKNRIEHIGQNAFHRLYYLEEIDISQNLVQTLPENMGLAEIIKPIRLRAHRNPFRCDCDLAWLVEKSKLNQIWFTGICKNPSSLRDLPINELIAPHLGRCKQPKFVQVMSYKILRPTQTTQKIILGSSVRLDCESVSSFIQWEKDGRILDTSNTVITQRLDNGSLWIRQVLRNHAGKYYCFLNNTEKKPFKMTIDLQVLEPPEFQNFPEKLTKVVAGSKKVLKCSASAFPPAQITWIQVITGRNLSTGDDLIIKSVNSSHSGAYQCIAANEAGFASREFNLHVVGDLIHEPRPPIVSSSFSHLLSTEQHNITHLIAQKALEQTLFQTRNALLNIEYTLRHLNVSGKEILINNNVYEMQLDELLALTSQDVQKLLNDRQAQFNRSILLAFARNVLRADSAELNFSLEIYANALDQLRRLSESGLQLPSITYLSSNVMSVQQEQLLASISTCSLSIQHTARTQLQTCSQSSCLKSYSSNGVCNHPLRPLDGASGATFRRLLPPAYDDYLHLPRTNHLPNPRLITLRLLSSEIPKAHSYLSHMLMQWGQFIDHDVAHAKISISRSTLDRKSILDCSLICDALEPCFSIPFPPGDPRHEIHKKLNISHLSGNCIELVRSAAVCGSGLSSLPTGFLQSREQINQATAYFDASQVYGSESRLASALREDNGRMKISRFNGSTYPPINIQGDWPNDCQTAPRVSKFGCFLMGDQRANEQLALTAMHILWLREHNRIASHFTNWSNNQIFHFTRRIIAAQMQIITYEQWIPYVFSNAQIIRYLPKYTGFDPNQQVNIANVFSSAAMRFGHTLIQPQLWKLDKNYQPFKMNKPSLTHFGPMPKSHMWLQQSFFAQHLLVREGIDSLLRGLQRQPLKAPGTGRLVNEQLTEHLFELARHIPLDLASINIQRGRDHGLPGYGHWLRYCGISKSNRISQLSHLIQEPRTLTILTELYEDDVDKVDIWVASILEKPETNSLVGPTLACLLLGQFNQTRASDPLWYEAKGVFSSKQLFQLHKSSLSAILCNNGDNIRLVGKDVFNYNSNLVLCEEIDQIDLKVLYEEESKKSKCK